MDDRFEIIPSTTRVGETVDLSLRIEIEPGASRGGRYWILFDIRQDAGFWQSEHSAGQNYITAFVTNGHERSPCPLTCSRIRTLDLYPTVPEFLFMCEVSLPDNLSSDTFVSEKTSAPFLQLSVSRWHAPERPIEKFTFWCVDNGDNTIVLEETGYKTYRRFVYRDAARDSARVNTRELLPRVREASLQVTGAYAPIPTLNTRRVPGIAWGELHGMAFNQRPIDDFYEYAKRETKLDFCAAVLFSYNTCVEDVWKEVKAAADRHLEPGSFIPVVAFECGTPNDDSHRVAYFFNPEDVPPIFCETRPPAVDEAFTRRFHPNTLRCDSLDEFYQTVKQYGGFVGGHFHTATYDREVLAELWQKQEFAGRYQTGKPFLVEEENIYEYMRRGMKMGFTGGSDTHDSMPGNPYPEPGCPRAAGFTGVHLDELTPSALENALLSRRTIATTGARIGIWMSCGDYFIGDIASRCVQEPFRIRVDSASDIDTVEVLRDGRPVYTMEATGTKAEFEYFPEPSKDLVHKQEANRTESFYHVRVRQKDRHVAWSSPIWVPGE